MQVALIAGGAGFIGSHLCESILQDQFKVICVDNLLTGNEKNIENLKKNSNFKFIKLDIVNEISKLRSELRFNQNQTLNLDYVFHLASPASPNKKSPRSYIQYPIETLLVNSYGTYNLLELTKEKNAKFLYASSSEIYGDPTVSPQKEDYFGNVNPIGVRSVYDEGKRFGEAMTMAYFRKYATDVRIIRIFNTYGLKMQIDDGRFISNFVNQAIKNKPITVYGDGTQTRSCCYVDDMVNGIKAAMFSQKSKGEVFNLGNPDERKVLEIATIIKNMTNSSSKITFEELPEDDPKIRHPDIQKAKELLNWEPSVRLEEGLRKTIDYFKNL